MVAPAPSVPPSAAPPPASPELAALPPPEHAGGLKHLTEEQVREWTLEQKDRWWLENVYRGDMPQLTFRSAITGMVLGGILSLTNLYVGVKTGWTLGVGITSVILAFAAFKVLSRAGVAKTEFTVLENNAMQSIATAAGYMTAPLVSSLAAYMMVTGSVIPLWVTIVWMVALSVLGVLFAFPLKRRFINDEQLPFPEGRAAGVVLDALHTGDAQAGMFKAKLMGITAGGAALLKLMQSHAIMEKLKVGFLAIPEYLDDWVYRVVTPKVMGTPLKDMTVRVDTDFVMVAAGGLMGIRTGVSILVGAVVNYCILVPWMISRGDIEGVVRDGALVYSFKNITMWALWGGVAMMTTSSLFAFFSKPKVLLMAFSGLFKKRVGQEDPLKHIELPMSVFAIGIPIIGALVILLAQAFFGVSLLMGAIAIPLVFVFTLIAVNSTGLTSITPTGALGKLTQLTFGFLAPGNISTNLMTAGITGEVAGNASNLLMDIKPGYMLGGKPRHQAMGHVLGIMAGALVAVPVFYLAFLRGNPDGLVTPEQPFPGAIVWKAVAEALTAGLSTLKPSAQVAALVGAVLGILLEATKILTKGKFWLSAVGLGLAFVIPFNTSFAMFLGAALFWGAERVFKKPESLGHKVMVQNLEPTAAGVIAGGALMGIAVILLEVFVLGG
jgi:uncharacterized oligopeptide transporter (OPT) family protein